MVGPQLSGGGSSDEDADYVIATVLPTLALQSEDIEHKRKQFTYDEVRPELFVELPVIINHKQELPSFRVGRVAAASLHGPNLKVLMAIDAAGSLEGTYASTAVSECVYGDVSLTHKWDEYVRATAADGGEFAYEDVVSKELHEVSLVKEGWRPGSNITGVFPSRRSLLRMDHDTLVTFTRRFGYPAPPDEAAYRDKTAKQIYIDLLHDKVQSDLHASLSSQGLVPKQVHSSAENRKPETSMSASSGKVSASAEAAVAAPADAPAATASAAAGGETTSSTEAMAAAAPQTGAQDGQQQQRVESVAPLTADDLMNKKVLAQKYLEAEKEKSELRAQLSEMSAFRAQYEAEQQQKRDEERRKTEAIIKSYVQWMREKKGPGSDEATVQAQAERYRKQAELDPIGTRELLQPTIDLLVQASNEAQSYKQRAEELERARASENERTFFDKVASQVNSFSQARPSSSSSSGSFARNMPPPSPAAASAFAQRTQPRQESAFSRRFSSSAAPAPAQPAAPERNNTFEASEQQQQPARSGLVSASNDSMKNIDASKKRGHEQVSSSSSSGNKAWAQEAFQRSASLAGHRVIPSYDEISRGGYVVCGTGRVQAGVNGSVEEETEIRLASDSKRDFTIDEFAPDVWDRIVATGSKRSKVCRPMGSAPEGSSGMHISMT